MSVEFVLSGSSLTLDEWNSVLEAWSEELGDAIYQVPRFDADLKPNIVLLGKGSVRGVFIKLAKDNRASFVLNAMASRADWRLALELLIMIQIRGGGKILKEDGLEFPLKAMTPEKADALALANMISSIETFRRAFEVSASTSGVAKLPVGGFRLPLKVSDLPESQPPSKDAISILEQILSERVRRYTQAKHAKTFVIDGGIRLSSWGFKPTLITQAHYIVIRKVDNPVPIERVRAILDEGLERIGPDLWYFPELSKEDRAVFLPQLRKASVKVKGFVKPKLATASIEDILTDSAATDLGDAVKDMAIDSALTGSSDSEVGAESIEARPTSDSAEALDPEDPMTIATELLVSGWLSSEEPEKVGVQLRHMLGISYETMELLVAVTARIMRTLFGVDGDPQPIESICDKLLADGISDALIKRVVSAIYKEISAED